VHSNYEQKKGYKRKINVSNRCMYEYFIKKCAKKHYFYKDSYIFVFMCFFVHQSLNSIKIKNRFHKEVRFENNLQKGMINGYSFPKIAVIVNNEPNIVQFYNWGLIPSWSQTTEIRKFTLNAKVETLDSKPSFKLYKDQRCIIILDAFYEWKWLDAKGKVKEKYEIQNQNMDLMTICGLWNVWKNPINQEEIKTFTMITTEANELMSQIHNTKKRMPMILNNYEEEEWLKYGIVNPKRNVDLVATKILT
jgi:putative SOS response-associated peptidase YedK